MNDTRRMLTNAQFWAYVGLFVVYDANGLVNLAATRTALMRDGWSQRDATRIVDALASTAAKQRLAAALRSEPPGRYLVQLTDWLARKLNRRGEDGA